MKRTLMCVGTLFVFFVAAAVAQTNPAPDTTTQGTQGTENSSPSMNSQQPNANPDSTQGTNSTAAQGTTAAGNANSSEKKMKGCIQSEGGQYVLQTKKGKDVMLTGQDVSAHVGHEVAVHGMWAGGTSDMSNTSSGTASASGKSFNVTSVDMISDTCSMGKGKKSGMGGMSGSTGSSTGTTTTPPQ